jgi:hypothetical protein
MKTYIENLEEISSDELLKGLLAHGLFAEKIPNFLSSESFYDYFISKSKLTFEQEGRDYIRYENIRNVNIPRLISIPNPFVYANLCKNISENWDKITTHFSNKTSAQTHKVSRIHIRRLEKSVSLFEMNYKHFDKDGDPSQTLAIKSKFLVYADISNCFPSIYSHSIPWALVGKEESKKKKNKEEWYNVLDFHSRNIKNQETNGLLIGPHTSNILSEIILISIDKELWNKGYRYIRHIDDYECYVESYEMAEKFLLDLSSELKKFELSLNTKKTQIIPLPQPNETKWICQLNSFFIGDKYTEDKQQVFELNRLKSFLNIAIEISLANNDSAVLNYAIQKIASAHLGNRALDYYINIIHQLLLSFPYLTRIVGDYVFNRFDVEKEKIKEIASDLYDVGISKNLFEACSFAIFWALKYQFTLDKYIDDDALNSNDCIFMLLSYLCNRKKKSKQDKFYRRKHKEMAQKLRDCDIDKYWLYVYEVLPENELTDNFKVIKKEKISFIKNEFKF